MASRSPPLAAPEAPLVPDHFPGPIGVFDSGVGGLTVLRALAAARPEAELLYLGDTARLPYGTKSPQTVAAYSLANIRFLLERGARSLVVACNTASALAMSELIKESPVPIIGVIEPGADEACRVTAPGQTIGVVATEATVRSDAYGAAIRARRPGATVRQQSCPLFVPLAEEGWLDHPVTREVAKIYFEQLGQVDTLVLGCTHYPLLHDVIAEVLGPEIQLVDSAAQVAQRIVGDDVGPGRQTLFVTDDAERFHRVARLCLGHEIETLHRVDVRG